VDDLTSIKNGHTMGTKWERGGFYGKKLFGKENAEGPADFAYTCDWIVHHNTVGMFNPIV
jgi:hypothetical protein